ncbi:hypothetical protein [Ottowia oryzae]|uniref:hypothetical protein n=1 Tax=Ottowia oryzae TaxID=2109914 RepID=UPI000F506ED6|nr:hypothetical protein [Ottowia oryzae]
MPPKRKSLTPQQKKALSYQKDRRNTYGERGANSRFSIRQNKVLTQQALRSVENQLLSSAINATSDRSSLDLVENALRSAPQTKRRFFKSPDTPLGIVVNRKLQRRFLAGSNAAVREVGVKAKDPAGRH